MKNERLKKLFKTIVIKNDRFYKVFRFVNDRKRQPFVKDR